MAAWSDNPMAEGGGEAPSRPPRREPLPQRVVRYGAMSWVGEFSHKPTVSLQAGAQVVIQTARGIELGECVGPPCGSCSYEVAPEQISAYIATSGQEFCQQRSGRILRLANEQDVNEQRHLNAHVREDIATCAAAADRHALDLKVVTAEHLLGGERIVFYFRSPGRVDFRLLVKELAQHYRTRIEMRQVGARDEARLVADYEICGRECCCKNFLKKLRPVNMKMAKLQKSTLDPSKVSGRCGRLRCCLRYEHDGYEELNKRLPRPGSRVETEFGPATVLDRQVLTQLVSVRTDEERMVVVPLEEIKAFNLPPAAVREAAAPSAQAAGPAGAAKPERGRRGTRSRRGRSGQKGEAPAAGAQSGEAPPSTGQTRPAGGGRRGRQSTEKPAGATADAGTDASSKPENAESAGGGRAASGGADGRPRRRRRRRPGKSGGKPPAKESGTD